MLHVPLIAGVEAVLPRFELGRPARIAAGGEERMQSGIVVDECEASFPTAETCECSGQAMSIEGSGTVGARRRARLRVLRDAERIVG